MADPRMGLGPVRREANVETIVEQLRGAARESWAQKWVRLINDIMKVYNVVDYSLIGFADPYNPNEVVNRILERCHGLTEPECAKLVEEDIRKHGERQILDESVEAIETELERYEKEAVEVQKAVNLFKLPVDVPPDVAKLLLDLLDNPEMNHETVYTIVKKELLSLGWPEQEAEQVASRSAEVIDKVLAKKKERALNVVHWVDILRMDTVRSKVRRKRQKHKAEELIRRLVQAYGRRMIVSVRDLESMGLARVKRASSKNVEEAIQKLKQQYRAQEATIALPATVFIFTDRPFLCRAVEIRPNIVVVEECEEQIILLDIQKGKVYYQVIPGGS